MNLYFYLALWLLFSACSFAPSYLNTPYLVEISNTKQSILALNYSNKALVYKKEKKYHKALELNKKSLEIHLQENPLNQEALSINYDTMGVLYHIMGKNDLAVKYFKKSLYIREKYFPKKKSFLADSYNNLAVVFESILNYKEALFYLKKSLMLRETITAPNQEVYMASLYSALGTTAEHLHHYQHSAKYHKQALAILSKKEPSLALASAYNNMTELLVKQQQYKRALKYYFKIKDIYERLLEEKSLDMARIYNNIGVAYMHLSNYDESLKYLNKSIVLKKSILGENTEFLSQEYLNLAWLHYYAKYDKKAYMYVVQSFKILLKQRDNYFSSLNPLENEHYLQNNKEHLYLLLQLTHELGDRATFQQSFTLWLQYKGSTFKNQNRMLSLFSKSNNADFKKKIEALKAEQRALAKLYYSKKSSKEALIESERDISQLKEELFLNTESTAIDFKSLVKTLKPNELYVDFVKVREHYFGFALNAKGEVFFIRKKLASSQKITKLIVNFHSKMKQSLQKERIETKEELSQLYKLLLKTLVEVLAKDKDTLILSMDGLLNLFPFETLFDKEKNQYLIEKKTIKYISSGRELVQLRSLKKEHSSQKIVLFSNPNFNKSSSDPLLRSSNQRVFSMRFDNLEGTKQEANLIQQIMKDYIVERYEGKEANEENLFKLHQAKIVHIATHGFFIKSELQNPMLNAGIALSGANESLEKGGDYGIVTALKLSGLDLKGTELVVLSACETGVVSLKSSESVSVLSKAFIQAGAKRVVASLWAVSDVGTKKFMGNFYENLHNKFPYDKALRVAKIKMIRDNISPAFWSAFILNGI